MSSHSQVYAPCICDIISSLADLYTPNCHEAGETLVSRPSFDFRPGNLIHAYYDERWRRERGSIVLYEAVQSHNDRHVECSYTLHGWSSGYVDTRVGKLSMGHHWYR